jgi:hypothetical protein
MIASDGGDQQATLTAAQAVAARPRLLIAEDNADNLSLLSDYLSAKGFAILVATSGAEAVQRAFADEPNLIVIDIQMPGVDGLEAIRQIRREPRFANTPIVALTALAMVGDRERCLDAGATAYLSKPVSMRQLVETLQLHLPS